jgi:hypothetical protein
MCGRSIAGIEGLNPDEDVDIHLQCVLYILQLASSASIRSLVQRSSTGSVRV